jgi:large subunit ribosomal protein L24
MKIRTGDTVYVISGKDKGKSGTVLRVLTAKNRVVVEGVNMRVRHIKKTAQGPGQRIKYEAGLSISNVMIVDPKTKKPTRVGYQIDAKGRKVRVAKGSGEIIVAAATAKVEKKQTNQKKQKSQKTEKQDSSESSASSASSESSKAPTKQPFWKRAFTGGPDDTGAGDTKANTNAANPATQIHRSSEGG